MQRTVLLAAAGGLAALVALRLAAPERYAALKQRLDLAAPSDDDVARAIVKRAYAETARGTASCCVVPSSAKQRSLSYSSAEQALGEATGSDLGLGCGNPIALALLCEGESVVDLGSGPGLDCLLASSAVGPSGRVCGVDMTQEMISKARAAAAKAKASNVEFRLGTLEALPLPDAWADVVISNCVVNLSPDKAQVAREAFRVLKVQMSPKMDIIVPIQRLRRASIGAPILFEVFKRSRSKSSPLEKTRSKLAYPVELTV